MARTRLASSTALGLGLVLGACGASQDKQTAQPPQAATPVEVAAPTTGPDPAAAAKPADTTFAVGKARVLLGDVPPWKLPRTVATALPEPTSKVGGETEAKALALDWRLLRTIRVGIGYLSMAELSPDGSQVFALSDDDGVLRRYDVKSGKELSRYPFPSFTRFDSIAFTLLPNFQGTPLEQPTQALYSNPSATGVLDLEAGRFEPTADPSTDLRSTSRPGLFGLTLHRVEPQSGTLQLVWIPGPAGGDRAAQISFIERPDNWALSADGKLLAVLYYPSDIIEVIDLESREVKLQVPAPKYARALALSPDNQLLAVGGEELRLYTFATGELVATDKAFGNNIHEIRFTPDGNLLLASSYDGKARSYRVESGKLGKKQLLVHGTANVYALGLDQAGSRLVTSSGDQTIKIWQR